jgi:hypothetical protein
MPDYLPMHAGVQISEAIAEAMASATIGDPILLTLELRHPSFVDESDNPVSAWIVNDLRNLVAFDENDVERTFIGVPFRYVKPEQSDSAAPQVPAVAVDNVSLEVTRLLMLAKGSDDPVQVIEREYLPSDLSAPHVLPVTVLELSAPVITAETVTGQLIFGNLTNRKYPARTYTAEDFPALAAS